MLSCRHQSCSDPESKLATVLACAIMPELTLNDFKLGWRNAAYRLTPAKHVAAKHVAALRRSRERDLQDGPSLIRAH